MRSWTQLGAIAILAACKDPTPKPEADDAPTERATKAAPCEVVDARGHGDKVDVGDFADPIARLVLAEGCPEDLPEVMARLAEHDARDCVDDGFSPVRTMLLSERAQLRGTPGGSLDECADKPAAIFRAVIQRNCGGRPPYALFGAVTPLATVSDELPDAIEMMGFDPDAHVFRFYTRESDRWHYHGDSLDMLEGPGPEGARRCAACHVGGGLVMKELDAPWVYWEGRTTTPGVQALLTQREELGSRTHGKVTDFRPAGKELEEAIVAGNRAWIGTRIAHQRRLLRPLFCDEEINLATAAQSPSPTTATEGETGSFELPVGGFLAAERLVGPEAISIAIPDYHQALRATNQHIATFCDKPLLTDDDATVIDTPFDFAYPTRASIDDMAVDALVEEGIVDEAFVRAVLAVDLTRPVFSTARCKLLDAVPELPFADRTPAKIRAALLAALEDDDSAAAAELKTNLAADAHDPTARISAMLRECAKRPPAELVADLHAYASQLRRKARDNPVIELPEVLPVDDRTPAPNLHLDPDTCRLAP